VKEGAIADRQVLSLPGAEGGRGYPLNQPRLTIAPSPTAPVVAATSKSTSVTKPVPPTGTLMATPKPRPHARPTGPTKLPATPVMQEAVRDALEISASDDLTADEMSELTELDASEREIQNLVSLEVAFNVTDLVLDDNHISNLKPLMVLTNLTSLHLSDNQVISIAPLESLINLLELDLSYNQFNDIGPLATNLGLADGTHVIVDEHPLELRNCS
jgi:Leucine-rich repeat (LRR) protein